MPSVISKTTKGKVKVPDKILLYGVEGVGKTTFATMAPSPYFLEIGQENGTHNLDVERSKVETFQDLIDTIYDLANGNYAYKTLVLDSYTQLEKLVWKQVCLEEGVPNIEVVGGGFSKGYIAALDPLRKVFTALNDLQIRKGMSVIGIAHSMKKTFTDPQTNASYDRYIMSVHEKFAGALKEWHDIVLFANHKVFLQGKPNQKQKAFGDGSRVMFSEYRPGFDAKCRYRVPFEMSLSYSELRQHIDTGDAEQALKLQSDIELLLAESQDEALNAKIRKHVEEAQGNVAKLSSYKDRVAHILKEKEGEQQNVGTTDATTTN